MNKSQINALLGPQITQIKEALLAAHKSKWDRAQAVYTMREMVKWEMSPFMSFKNFFKQLKLEGYSYATAIVEMSDYRAIARVKLNDRAITLIATNLPFGRAVMFARHYVHNLQQDRKRGITGTEFIKQAKAMVQSGTRRTINGAVSDTISLHLDPAHMAKFEHLIAPYGFIKSANGKRLNLRESVEAWLDTL